MIHHMVVFKLRSGCTGPAEEDFFAAVRALVRIDGVRELECFRQISPKCRFAHGITMKFADAAAYRRYSEHPDHVRFVEERWQSAVEDFMEIDLTPRS